MKNHYLYSDKPAANFREAFPLGNGRLGAMFFGGIEQEKIILNESSMWSGSKDDMADRIGANIHLPEIRKLLLDGKKREAQDLFNQYFTCSGEGSGAAHGAEIPFGCYQVLGTLNLNFFQYTPFDSILEGVNDYKRILDLDQAFASSSFRTRYSFKNVSRIFRRDVFASAPDEAIVIRLQASVYGDISFIASFDRPENFSVASSGNDTLIMSGTLPDGKGGDGISYACMVKAVSKHGEVYTKDQRLYVKKGDNVILYVTAATTLSGFMGRGNNDAFKAARDDMNAVSQKSWDELFKRHQEYYQKYIKRTSLTLSTEEIGCRTVQDLIFEARRKKGNPALDELYFTFCRYLFISSSRKGEIPANLQGIWAEEIQTPFNGDWHFDAQQMLYWPAEVWNLSELHEPYLRLIESLQEPGAKTAKAYYNSRGWVVHTFTNAWGFTSPGEDAAWGATTGGTAWLCQHLWDHYLYTGNLEYLKWAYPVMKNAALFFLDSLVEEPTHKWLVTSPSESPENHFYDEQNRQCALCMGATYDNQLLRFLFQACINSAKTLEIDADFANMLGGIVKRLPPTRMNSEGKIMEWLEDYREFYPYHRHTSHLWGVYPGVEINCHDTPELAKAALKSLHDRGDTTPGWSIGYRACILARLHQSSEAYQYAQKMIQYSSFPNLLGKCHHAFESQQPAPMPDFNDYGYAFQMDGNMGVLTAFAEMLVQSFAEYTPNGQVRYRIDLLPCLPANWKSGKVTGLCAKGGLQIDLAWKDGNLTYAKFRNAVGQNILLCWQDKEISLIASSENSDNFFIFEK